MRLGIGRVEFGKEPPVKLTQRGLTLASLLRYPVPDD